MAMSPTQHVQAAEEELETLVELRTEINPDLSPQRYAEMTHQIAMLHTAIARARGAGSGG